MDTLNAAEDFLEELLKDADLWTPENIETIQESDLHQHFHLVLYKLNRWNLLTQANLDAAITIAKNYKYRVGLLCFTTPEFFKMVEPNHNNIIDAGPFIESIVKHQKKLTNFADMLKKLNEAKLLTKEYIIGLIAKHKSTEELSFAFTALNKANLLTKEYVDLVINHQQLLELADAFRKLQQRTLLTQVNIQALLDCPVLLSPIRVRRLYDERIFFILPDHLITQEVFNRLIRIGRGQHHDVQRALQRYIIGLLYGNDNVERGRGNDNNLINPIQSTHKTSVHQSVSESAKALKRSYNDKLIRMRHQLKINYIHLFIKDKISLLL